MKLARDRETTRRVNKASALLGASDRLSHASLPRLLGERVEHGDDMADVVLPGRLRHPPRLASLGLEPGKTGGSKHGSTAVTTMAQPRLRSAT